ncbi:DUF2336 domain-containing protein [Magnetospirillum gryphiswaldense]|uniref:DUF2336 domain-containing protein n=2 Tax=Magnetospirillum gryphiswaldense TaxID=55518 RepID=V6F1R2_MAGGM|nr:DUF2336 domain-containing protein [Magnetospirillum gryphiswaldense]AVM74651.1 hypothetical protein MSR1_21660 [Magnetospirillum gryphiswaldense MSR-1]AVM78554.1 hypothetical protein MSR1L_21660 [Magnetospirillum gryphiswaldense]CAM75970.1 conserved hypothetical protein [Magnetospirillum gryphiswaldense MSR-1]CDK99384.1 conserved protein of unknown function [Magnetospirillum gryphiswaldense MSR-1 v2]
MEEKLREEDVARLLANPSADIRAEIADKIAGQHQGLSQTQRKLAEDIFRLMAKDAEVRVREALARQLKENPTVPHDIAASLARDVESVSLPMLQFSEVLTDEDLIEIVKSQGAEKQVAVAKRAHVSAGLADALVDTHNESVVATLVGNDGAEIAEATLQRVVDEFAQSDAVGGPLVSRRTLPVTVAERLMTRVSENLRQALMARPDMSPETATNLMLQARELAVLGLADADTDVLKLVDHLYRNARLTPSIILRAVCMGDMTFFEAAMAKLARIKLENARTLIHDAGKRGFEALFDKAGLPKAFYAAMRAAIDVSYEMEYDGGPNDRERFSRRMIERILTQYGDLGVDFENDDLEYLLAKMNQLPATTLSE